MISLHNISKSFGAFAALHNIDLAVRDGEFLALLGPSGSGKTTLLRIIAGLAFPDEGEVRFNGEDVTELPVAERKVGKHSLRRTREITRWERTLNLGREPAAGDD